jgi:shikimate dehydrogenase
VLALAEAGASEVAVLNRTPERAAAAAALAGAAGSVLPAERAGSPEDDGREDNRIVEIVGSADLIVNATPLGMAGAFHGGPADWLVAPQLLHSGQVAADLVYVPRPTRWLTEAAAAGAQPVDGLGMLVHQAAAQLELWTGQPSAVEAMWQVAEAVDLPKPPGARET